MNIKSYLAVVALCVIPLTSTAGVFYHWVPTNDGTPTNIKLELEFDKKTVKMGMMNLDFKEWEGAPKRGLLSMRYNFESSFHDDMYYSAKNGGFDFQDGTMRMSMLFKDGEIASGSIAAYGFEHHLVMEAIGNREFEVIDTDVEGGSMECGWVTETPCGGATGYFQRVAEVPEPASFALLGLGAAALVSTRRRKLVK